MSPNSLQIQCFRPVLFANDGDMVPLRHDLFNLPAEIAVCPRFIDDGTDHKIVQFFQDLRKDPRQADCRAAAKQEHPGRAAVAGGLACAKGGTRTGQEALCAAR